MSKLSGYMVFPLGGLLLWPATARADSYEDAFARSRQHQASGDLGAAAGDLEAILAEYPQDYSLVIELAWLRFRAGQYRESERAYREAIRRSPAALDAHLGLGWALARQGRCAEAEPSIRRYQETYPASSDAREVIAFCSAPAAALAPAGAAPVEAPPVALSVSAAWGKQWLPSHPIKTGGQGVTLGADAAFSGHWLLGGAFRYTSISTVDGAGVDPFSQREFYGYAGYATARAGLVFHLASINDGSGTFGTSTHAGASLRLSGAAGDALLSGYVSSYSDKTILRIEPSWRVPLGEHFSVIPGVAVQRTDTDTLATATVNFVLDGAAGRLWFGGKYGTEERPAYLAQSVVLNLTERIRGGFWFGGRLPLTERLAATAQYSFDRLERTDSLTPSTSAMHSFSLGLVANF